MRRKATFALQPLAKSCENCTMSRCGIGVGRPATPMHPGDYSMPIIRRLTMVAAAFGLLFAVSAIPSMAQGTSPAPAPTSMGAGTGDSGSSTTVAPKKKKSTTKKTTAKKPTTAKKKAAPKHPTSTAPATQGDMSGMQH